MPSADSHTESRVFDKTIVTLLAAGFAAIGLTGLVVNMTPDKAPRLTAQQSGIQTTAAQSVAAQPAANVVWATSAPGRVEPKGGKVHLRPEATGRIVQLHAAVGGDVRQGDLIAQLRDDEALARIVQAQAEVAVRLGERDEESEEPEKDQRVLDRRKAADELAVAERARHEAWRAFDAAYLDHRAGRASDKDLQTARDNIKLAEENIATKSGALTIITAKKETPLPTRLDSGLTLARADLRLAEIAYDNTRIRAPINGMLLRFDAKVGEMALPSARMPLAVFGDMSAIQITAEVQERDVSKVRLGQSVIVRSNAFGNSEYPGKVTEVAPVVGSPGLRAQGPRQQLDAEVLEVKIELEGKPPVMPGMRVDVFFKAEQRVSAVTK